MPHELNPVRAIARSNIALAKYWGKADVDLNLPAVPSLSLTLDELVTETEVEFEPSLARDELHLDGREAPDHETGRVTQLLNRVRSRAEIPYFARVRSENRFPTAAGLASSASGFAALAAAASRAANLELTSESMSTLARQSSASAARSVFGGFVELDAGVPGEGGLGARQVAAADHWDVRLVVAITATGPKSVGSTEAMTRSKRTSPFYAAWVDAAPRWFDEVKSAVARRDLERLGQAMEQSTLAFHACAMTSLPSTVYWGPGTMDALNTVRSLRAAGTSVWATMDAGPHVKALCETRDSTKIRDALLGARGVHEVIVASPGRGVEVIG
ncbi:MAG: diphosphomevalonate decarboxylase [Polyangiales bacterium]